MGGEEVKELTGLEVKKIRGGFVFTWDTVKNAKATHFILKKKSVGKDTVIVDQPVADSSVTLPTKIIQYDERYEWMVSGTSEGRDFNATAEFILTR